METVETYIIRIYRRDREDPRKLAGLVETVEKNEKKTFASEEELLNILNTGRGKNESGIPENSCDICDAEQTEKKQVYHEFSDHMRRDIK